VREFVEAHLASPIRLDQLATVAGVSRGHFVRVFRRATGQSPHQYVVNRRVDFVRERLSAPGADLTDLSVRAGFASHSHMAQAFRRRIGLTPSAFRALATR
jgi:AraC family transcriptional regulator